MSANDHQEMTSKQERMVKINSEIPTEGKVFKMVDKF
jgi:hypothetical protein